MIIAGLIGYPVAHSASPELFRKIFRREGFENARYELFPIQKPAELPGILQKNKNLTGLNVTIPHKISILPYLDELAPEALQIGSVNTIAVQRNTKGYFLKGFNTDAAGFRAMTDAYLPAMPKGALILGSGGVSRTVQYVLSRENIPFVVVSRFYDQGDMHYSGITSRHFREYPLIINCTPAGMHPHTNTCPSLPFDKLSSVNTIFDLIYNPAETLLMQKAKSHGAFAYNGSLMLYEQAEKAFEIWKQYF